MLCGVNSVLRKVLGAWKVGTMRVHSLICLGAQASPHHAGQCPLSLCQQSVVWVEGRPRQLAVSREARLPLAGPWTAGRLLPIQYGSANIDEGRSVPGLGGPQR